MPRPDDTMSLPLGHIRAALAQLATEPADEAAAGLLDLAAPRPGETVVDLGCRSLGHSFRAMQLVGAAGRVRGIVQSRADQEHANALRDRWIFADLAFEHADPEAVPLDDEVADVVLVNGALEHTDEPIRVLEEACRLLAPKGRLALAVEAAEAARMGALLEVLGLEPRTARPIGHGRRALLALEP